MRPFFNFRNLQLLIITALVLIVKYMTDPTGGAVTQEFLLYVSTPILVILITHYLRKFLFPYVDMGDLYDEAKKSSVGAGLAFVGMAIVIYALMSLFGPSARAQDVNTYIPVQAYNHLPTLNSEINTYWADIPKKPTSPR